MSSSPKILLVEDDRYIASTLLHALRSSYQLDIASSGKLALYKTDTENYALVVLDLNLPDISGLAVCQQLRERGVSAPILILSGESKVITKIALLDAGANDYLTKPFALGEFKARLRALARIDQKTNWSPTKVEVSGVEIDRGSLTALRNGVDLKLRRKEFELLECLMINAGSIVSRQDLARYVWHDHNSPWTNALDVHIKYLRDKLDRPFSHPLILTVHGLGYKFVVQAELSLAKVNA